MQFISANTVTVLPFVAFVVLLILQHLLPRRDLGKSGLKRLAHNGLLFLSNLVILRLLIPLSLLSCAEWAAAQQIGVFNNWQLNNALTLVLCVVVLDLAIYWQHVATHKFAWLWRLHKVHHADHDMDVTTAIRFHPVELILSLLYKALFVMLLGAPVVAVVIFELLLFISPAFNHSNLKLANPVDGALRQIIVTPDMHRVHHSVILAEQNSNYGFFLSCWDKLFKSYTAEPQMQHATMPIGLEGVGRKCERLDQMLVAPLKNG